MAFKYKEIKFAKEFNHSLAEFKEMFASHQTFLNVPHLERDAEMEKVWKNVMKHNGFDTRVPAKIKSDKGDKG